MGRKSDQVAKWAATRCCIPPDTELPDQVIIPDYMSTFVTSKEQLEAWLTPELYQPLLQICDQSATTTPTRTPVVELLGKLQLLNKIA